MVFVFCLFRKTFCFNSNINEIRNSLSTTDNGIKKESTSIMMLFSTTFTDKPTTKLYSTSSPQISEASTALEVTTSDWTPIFEYDKCSSYSTCSYLDTIGTEYCRCDDDCVIYNDCCYPDHYTRETRNTTIYPYSFKCRKFTTLPGFEHEGVFVVAACPGKANSTVQVSKCNSDNLTEVGPWVVDGNWTLFKNKFCAECYEVVNYIPLDVKFIVRNVTTVLNKDFETMSSEDKMIFLYNKANLYYNFTIPSHIKTRYCLPIEMDYLSPPDCQRYPISPVATGDNGFMYRNYHCIPPGHNPDFTFCFGPYIDFLREHTVFEIQPLTVLFSFTEKTQVSLKSNLIYFSI